MGGVTIDVYSHYFKISGFGAEGRSMINAFCTHLTHYASNRRPDGRYERVQGKVFAARDKDKTEYRFPITVLSHFIPFLEGRGFYKFHTVKVVTHEMYTPASIDITINPKLVPRDYQEPIIEFTTCNDENASMQIPKYRRVVPIQMGRGKTAIALFTADRIKKRTVIVLKPRFIQQWIDAIEGDDDRIGAFKYEGSDWKKGDLLVVKGGRDLAALISLAKAGELDAKIIIISNKTLAIFINEFEEGLLQDFYGCRPDELFELLGVGLRIIDEVHMDFHANFKADLYTHVPLSVELSATLNPSDDFLKKMYKLMLPMICRYTGLVYDQYIAVTAIFYYLNEPNKIKHKRNGMYNHALFEDSIRKYVKTTNNYYAFIARLIDSIFVQEYKPLQKCLVFCGKIETCQSVGEYLQKKYPQFKVGVFVGGSDESILKDSDLIVSTLQSCGTAKDIPNLVSVLTTVASDTNQGNEQAMGRLRPIKAYPDMVPRYYYLVCADISKHVQYHRTKMKLFHGKAKSHSSVNSGIRI